MTDGVRVPPLTVKESWRQVRKVLVPLHLQSGITVGNAGAQLPSPPPSPWDLVHGMVLSLNLYQNHPETDQVDSLLGVSPVKLAVKVSDQKRRGIRAWARQELLPQSQVLKPVWGSRVKSKTKHGRMLEQGR